jgi:hypothetical protein
MDGVTAAFAAGSGTCQPTTESNSPARVDLARELRRALDGTNFIFEIDGS